MKVNFIDLKAQYLSIKREIDTAIQEVLNATAFAGGPFVETFEKSFAEAHQAKYCIAMNSGTAALHALLMALEIGRGDEVIVPANTFFATPEAVSLAGATPVFVDCEASYFNIDPGKVEGAITKNTKAIFAVHLYGQPAQLSQLKEISDKYGLILLEDCAQAHLAEYKNKPVGTYGLAGCFSFYPGKNLGAFGEGGAVVTNDEELAYKLSIIRTHGARNKYYHEVIGHNYRMEGMQGAILSVKLAHLENWTEIRRKNAELYRKYLHHLPNIQFPEEMSGGKHVYHLFVIRVDERQAMIDSLEKNGIYTGIHYPVPCHLQKAYEGLRYEKGSMPITEQYASEILSLPMSEQLKESEIQYIAQKIEEFLNVKV